MYKPGAVVLKLSKLVRSNLLSTLTGVSLAILASTALGYLIVSGQWQIALALLLGVPALIVFSRYPFLAVLVWLAFSPFVAVVTSSLQQAYWLLHRLLPLGVFGLMIVNHILGLHPRQLPKPGRAEWGMAAYGFASLVSILLLNENPGDTLQLLYDRVLIPMILYMIIRLWSPTETDFVRLMPSLLFLVISQMTIGLLAWFQPSLLPSQWLEWAGKRTTGSLRSYGAFTAAMIFGGLPLLHTALHQVRGWLKNTYLAAFLLSVLGAFISFSRAGWLAMGLVLAGLFTMYPKGTLRAFLVLLPVILILVAGPLAGQVQWASERLNSEESEASALSRLPTYLASLRMIQARPIFGWGYENFNRYDFQFYRRVGDLVNPDKDHSSHNFFLTLLAEQGLVGFLLFLFPFGYWLSVSTRVYAKMPANGFISRKFLGVLWLFLLAFLVINMFQSMRVVYALGLMWVNLGLIAAIVEPFSKQDMMGVNPSLQQLSLKETGSS